MEYCKKLHELHNHFPLASEKIEDSYDMLSKYCKEIADQYGIKVGGCKKLVLNLGNKKKYRVHYKNLQLYLPLGMKLTKVHKSLSFKQSNWLNSYIDFNTEKRKESVNDFDKDFFKLMINCIFGKSCESVRKRCNIKLISNKKIYQRCADKLNFISLKIIDENLVAVHCSRSVLTKQTNLCWILCLRTQ